jgi:hypothetical protein
MARPILDESHIHPAIRDTVANSRQQLVQEVQAAVADDGETDCWTHAWQVARRTGGTYVEGLCVRKGASGPSFHAWVERDHPLLGRILVETTPGYEEASHYVGIAVDNTPGGTVEKVTSDWTIRSSVLQAALAGGGTVEQVLDTCAVDGGYR